MVIMGYTVSSALIWIVIAVVFAIIEATTLGLTTIWFTIGGVAACIVSLFNGHWILQVITFLAVSCLLLYFTKPLAVKKLKIGNEKTNVDALVGQSAVVIEDITPYNTGQVKAGGHIWTAISDKNDAVIKKSTEVKILRIEGVKLVVKPVAKNNQEVV